MKQKQNKSSLIQAIRITTSTKAPRTPTNSQVVICSNTRLHTQVRPRKHMSYPQTYPDIISKLREDSILPCPSNSLICMRTLYHFEISKSPKSPHAKSKDIRL